jgi:hypothetical protein
MKKGKKFQAFAAALAAVILFSGCSLFQKNTAKNQSSAVPAASFTTSSSSVVREGSESSQPETSSSSAVVSVNPNEPTSSQSGPVLNIQTDNASFDAKFKDNPIDKKYITASNSAISTVDMVSVSNKYAQVWQDEITHAWSELTKEMSADSSTKPAALKAEQQKWKDGKTAAIQKIGTDARAAGGSLAQVNEDSQIMNFYRSRAAQLYRELYDYNKDYTYAFTS